MKRRIYFLATLLLCSLTVFTSCGDDIPGAEEPGTSDNTAKTINVDATAYNKWVYINLTNGSCVSKEIDPIAGTYVGNTALSVAGKDQGTVDDMKLEANRISSDSVNFVLKDFSFGQYGWIGDITSGVKIEIDSIGNELGYVLAGSQFENILEKYNVKATTTGQVIGKNIELKISMKMGNMPMPVIAIYKGTIEKGTVDETSFIWDIAIHRSDVKTNNGAVVTTTFNDIASAIDIPADGYTEDVVSNEIAIDMTNMMTGRIGYATDHINNILNSWISRSGMPPVYTLSEKVYVLKTSAGKYVKIQFTDYTNDSNETGHISFKYMYFGE